MSTLYNRIDQLCKNRKVSITVMCKEAEVSRASLSDLKMGRNQSLSADTLSKIASFFGVTVDYLLTGTSSYTPTRSFNEENPWETELLEAFDGLSLGNQIEAVAQVQRIAENKKAPAETGERIDMSDVDVAFYGDYKELCDDDQKTIRDMVRVMRERRTRKEEK